MFFPQSYDNSRRNVQMSCGILKTGAVKLSSSAVKTLTEVLFTDKTCFRLGWRRFDAIDRIMEVFVVVFSFQKLPKAIDELKELREFYDPDTVELMEFIKYEHNNLSLLFRAVVNLKFVQVISL